MKVEHALADGISRNRKRLGMTQAELAEAIGVTEQFVSLLERGKRSATLDTVQALAEAFDLEVWELLRPSKTPERRRRDDATTHVTALLQAWPEHEQQELVKLLIALRRIASTRVPAKRKPRR